MNYSRSTLAVLSNYRLTTLELRSCYSPSTVINPRRACAARVTVLGLSFHPSICLSVTTFSPATRNKMAKKPYQRVQCHTGFILKLAFLVKMLHSKVMA